MKPILLTLILGAIAPVYLQAGTAASTNTTDVKSAADVKSAHSDNQGSFDFNSSDLKKAIEDGHSDPTLVHEIICEMTAFDENDCKLIIEWLRQAPQQRKNTNQGCPSASILASLISKRYGLRLENKCLQPAIDFLFTLRPVAPYPLYILMDMYRGHVPEHAESDYRKLGQQLMRLNFLQPKQVPHRHTLLEMRRRAEEDAKLSCTELKIVQGRPDWSDAEKNRATAQLQLQTETCQAAIVEINAIHQEAVERVGLDACVCFKEALLPELQPIVASYSTELTLDEARRALAELSAPQPQQPKQ